MKKTVLFLAILLLTGYFGTAQVLYSEDFDNLTLGNVGTDPTGQTPGQGGWHTRSYDQSNNYFKIVSEPGRGKVMELITPQSQNITNNALQKRGVDDLWNNRTPGNDVLKIEYDFFTGPYNVDKRSIYALYMSINNDDPLNPTNNIIHIGYAPNTGVLNITANAVAGSFYYISTQQLSAFTDNTWVRLIVYIDYPNQKIYFSLPSIGVLMVHDAPNVIPPVNSLLFIAGTNGLTPSFLSFYKFDNFVVSAVNTVPLSTQSFISSKFNVFPNPVNDVVTITNNENINIEQVEVFDITGKTVKVQKGNNEKENTLNLEDLSSGTYLLHVKTEQGIAINKLIKN